jgi:hypothetical protein
MEDEARIPTALWLEAQLRRLNAEGRPHYVVHAGAYASGTVLLKINALDGTCRLLIQQRDINGLLGWANALAEAEPTETKADHYIRRAIARDPDLWVVEVEDRAGKNPF